MAAGEGVPSKPPGVWTTNANDSARDCKEVNVSRWIGAVHFHR